MNRSPRNRRFVALALAPIVVVSFGCSKAADKAAEKAAEKIAEDAIGDNANVDVDGDGNVRIETEDGSFETDEDGNVRIETEDGTYTGGQGLPEGWPDDIPLPDGVEVTYGAASTDGLTVMAESADPVADVYDDLKASLDGWTVEDEYSVDSTDGDMRSARFVDGDRNVSVSVMATGDSTSVSLMYTVEAA